MLAEHQIPPVNISKLIPVFLKGIPASSGISISKCIIIEQEHSHNYEVRITEDKIDSEIQKLIVSVENLNTDYNDVVKNSIHLSSVVIQIIESYQLILNDDIILNSIKSRIKSGFDAESSISREFDSQKNLFLNSKDQLLKERSVDLENVKNRLLSYLNQKSVDYSLAQDKIIVTQNLTPTDLLKYKEQGALGIITEIGGIASHVCILARSFEMPAIIGVKDAVKLIKHNSEVIIDGFTGLIIANPDTSTLKKYKKRIEEIEEHKLKLGSLVKVDSRTNDQRVINLLANVDRLDDVKQALINGAEGIGLARTETLLSGLSKIPGEEIQYGWYREIADRIFPNMATIRCFDIGSDKFSYGIPIKENNPALGLRGIRYLLNNIEIFKTQIKAILRASVNKNIKIMLPMISDIHELRDSKKIISGCMKELNDTGVSFDKSIKVGIMIETPAAVIMSELLAKESDFFSIGTNDLTQYVLAADRTNELVTEVYDSFHPAVLRMIEMTIKSALKSKIPLSICGELASHSAATQILIGLGVTELSVPPPLILELKNRILNINYSQASHLAKKIIDLDNSNDILQILEN